MSLPSGVFTRAVSGKLQVAFSGYWLVNNADWGSGAWSLNLRGVVAWGSERRTVLMGLSNNSGVIEVDYTAGTDVAVSMDYISHTFGGAGTVAATKLMIRCRLFKT